LYAHALTYPSLRRRRVHHRVRASRRPLLLRGRSRPVRALARRRAARLSWPREIARVTLALANAAAAAVAVTYFLF